MKKMGCGRAENKENNHIHNKAVNQNRGSEDVHSYGPIGTIMYS